MSDHSTSGEKPGVSKRGFAAMDPARLREVAAMGGATVPASSRAFSDREFAVTAGRKAGQESARKRKALREAKQSPRPEDAFSVRPMRWL